MKQKKLANILVTLGFLGFLALMLVVTLVRPKESWSYYENRNLARPAELTLENLWNGTFPNSVESVLQDHAAGRNTMLKLSTWLDLEVFHRPVVNEIVPTQDKLLGYLAYETVDPQYIHDRAQEIGDIQAQLRDVVESCGGSYYYVALPGQYHYFADQYPDYLNSGADKASLTLKEFTAAMEERGVNLINGGIAMDQAGHPAEFYSTVDHHYTFAGAVFTYRTVMDWLNQDLGLDLTVLQEEDLTYTTLENPYLGSRSRKLFGLWQGTEKLTYAEPVQPIEFTRVDNGTPNWSTVYALPATAEEDVLYTAYMGGDIGETVIDTGRDELPNILIYGDSFTNPLECLMYYSFNEMHSIDLRYYKDMTLEDYIRLYQPDIVLCIRDYGELLSTDFNGDPFHIQ